MNPDQLSAENSGPATRPAELTEAELSAMVDASPDGMLLADELGVVLFVNSQMESLFGYARDELLGQSIEVLLPERFRQQHAAHRTRYRAEPVTRAMGTGLDLVARHRDGREFPVEISLSPIRSDDGLRVVATVRDITDRLAADAHANAVLRTIDAAHDGVFMFDPGSLRFIYVNQGAVQQLGYSTEELLAMTPLHIKPEFTDGAYRELLAPLVAGEVPSHTYTTVHRRKDGLDVPVEIVLEYPPASQPRHPRYLVALVRDVTQRLRSEQFARTQQTKVRVLEDRERVARDLHDVVIQRLFATGMSLQAMQPLATDPALNTRISETVHQLDETIAELRSTVFELTSRTGLVVAKLQEHVEEAAVSLGYQPTVEVDGDLESVSPEILDELFPTLSEALSNVARHAHATRTDITIEVGEESVVLTVTDDGVGIDPAAPRGNGLNNFEARAALLGGLASITSSGGEGTTITWAAPRA